MNKIQIQMNVQCQKRGKERKEEAKKILKM